MIRLSRAQSREIDRLCIEEYGLPGIVLMENAARSAADEIMNRLPDRLGVVACLCGSGNNGGDAYAVARHLHNRDVDVVLFEASTASLSGDAAINQRVTSAMKLPIRPLKDIESMRDGISLWVDGLFGTGLARPIVGRLADAIAFVNRLDTPIVALDLPSGLDCDTGEPLGDACIRADLTITFVAEKIGFANPTSRAYTGDIVVAEIGCPRAVIDRVLGP